MSRNRLYGSLNFFQKKKKKMTHESFLSRNKTPISFRFSSDALSNLLDMDPKTMPEDEDFVEWVAGNKVIKGSIPLSLSGTYILGRLQRAPKIFFIFSTWLCIMNGASKMASPLPSNFSSLVLIA